MGQFCEKVGKKTQPDVYVCRVKKINAKTRIMQHTQKAKHIKTCINDSQSKDAQEEDPKKLLSKFRAYAEHRKAKGINPRGE